MKFKKNEHLPANDSVDYVLDRIDDEFECDDLNDYLFDEVDTAMIYYDCQWDLLKDYFNPSDLDQYSLGQAYEYLMDDLMECFDEVECYVEDDEDED